VDHVCAVVITHPAVQRHEGLEAWERNQDYHFLRVGNGSASPLESSACQLASSMSEHINSKSLLSIFGLAKKAKNSSSSICRQSAKPEKPNLSTLRNARRRWWDWDPGQQW